MNAGRSAAVHDLRIRLGDSMANTRYLKKDFIAQYAG
jgi:hypothetical protein